MISLNPFNWLKRSKMKREIIINVEKLETRVAVMENGRLEEFMVEHPEEERLVGSVFKGRVQNLENDLQAAFVDIGLKKNAFLHYWDMTPDADALLDAALIKASASSEYKAYKRTDEYKEAYEGKNAKVASYKITEERLDAMVKALGQGLYDTGLHSTVNTIAGLFVGITLSDKQYKNLSVDELLSIAKGLGIDLDKESVMEVLAPFSNYEYSNVLPVMNFIEDETLRTYAYAKYFGETHGANVGSALIPSVKKDATGKKEYGKIGHITMSTSGLSYEENAFTLEESYLLRAQCGYAPTMFPLFAARRYAYIFAGIIALMYALFYYAKMKVYCKGKKIEKFCIKGGAM